MKPTIEYIGEHLWPGMIGQFCVTLSFVAILFSIFAYYRATKTDNTLSSGWSKLGRGSFIIHGLSVFTLIGTIFYMMGNHMYEYAYVQAHVSDQLPMRYIFSAFWEGQEGSFLLWMFWHVVLGFVIIRKSGEWQDSVMIFLGLIQAILASMLLGIHLELGDFVYKIGSNPALLLRDVFEAPIFEKADYVSSISGTGLNALLQNYWMTIHPPTLFLGFASTTVPFAYAAAGMYTGKTEAWVKPVMKWALFSAGILGIGILMGSAWAYEALTFGGYWAWDPVENMSLVPWIILVAGVHTNLIANATGRAIKSTFAYYSIAFVGILYSTYLTRSGILGDTSAHAFTEMGLEPQLIFMVFSMAALSLYLIIKNNKKFKKFAKEEAIASREFWMFVGALVLLFSGTIIAASTSLPVLNALIAIKDPEFVGTVISDPIPHFNKFQIWIAILLGVLSAKTIFLRYKAESMSTVQVKSFVMMSMAHVIIAGALTFVLSIWLDYFHWKYALLAFSAFYTIVANLSYLVIKAKMNPKMAASVCSHAGFGIMIIGILASGLNEQVVTTNPFAMKGIIKDEGLASSVKLIKNEAFHVNDYWITYESDTVVDKTRTFKIKFEEAAEDLKKKGKSFYVYPNILFSNDLTKVAASNPDAKHYLSKDIFTSIASLPKSQMDIKYAKEEEDSMKYVSYELSVGDTLFTKGHYGIVEGYTFEPTGKDYNEHENDLGIGVSARFRSLTGDYDETVEAAIGVRENLLYQYNAQLNEPGVKLRVNEKTFDNFFSTEDKLNYSRFSIKRNESFEFAGREYLLTGFEQELDNPNYKMKEGDIAVQAVLVGTTDDEILKPCYIIRDGKPFNIKDYDSLSGIHCRLLELDPVKDLITFALAKDDRSNQTLVVDIAEDVSRSDIIVLEALMFPGINLFWSGSLLMLLGFFLSLWNRRRSNV